MIKYKKKTSHIIPGFTYLFEFKDGITFEGIYLRPNKKNSKVYLFKNIAKHEDAPVYSPDDPVLEECVWVNNHTWEEVVAVWEVNKPDFVKPEFDKKENFSAALVFSGLPMHGMDCCNICGKKGTFIRMALVCADHGVFGGV